MMVFLYKDELLTMYHGWVLVSSQCDSCWQKIELLVVVKDENPSRLGSIFFLQMGLLNIDLCVYISVLISLEYFLPITGTH